MSLDINEYNQLAFSTNFNYLHVVLSGSVITGGTATVALPADLSNPYFRVFMDEGTQIIPVTGLFSTGADAYVKNGSLYMRSFGGSNGTATKTFYYFVYGGNYV